MPDQDDLQHRAALVLNVRHKADLLEDVRLHVLRLVDDDGRMRPELPERREKLLQGANEIVAVRLGHDRSILREDAEVLKHLLEKIVPFEQWVVDNRQERLALEPLENGPAEQRLAGADFTGYDDDRFAALECVRDLGEGRGVRRALEPESGIRREAERRLVESEKPLVAVRSFARRVVTHQGDCTATRS